MSLTFHRHASLKAHNTFGLPVYAEYFCELDTLDDLPDLLQHPAYQTGPVLWLGGGSNLLFTRDYPGLVVHIRFKGRQLLADQGDQVLVEAAAGENWHDWVRYTLEQGWFGLENLSLIPGTVGASPVQNIGAYGIEVKDWISDVICADLQQQGKRICLQNQDCQFAYRDSIFKGPASSRYLVCAVRFLLSKKTSIKTTYGDIERTLQSMPSWPQPTALDVSKAVSAIRAAKLPDPAILGNAGSFFKNPVIPMAQADLLLAQYPAMPCYPAGKGHKKLAAGWLIEQAGLKGYRQGDAGVHSQQALVLVNHGTASGADIIALADHVRRVVQQRYAVTLETEPQIL